MRATSAMQKSGVIVSAMGQDIPQRVLSEPVSVPWMAIRKTVNATPCHHDLRIQLAVRERQIGTHRLHPIVRRKGCSRHLFVPGSTPPPLDTRHLPPLEEGGKGIT